MITFKKLWKTKPKFEKIVLYLIKKLEDIKSEYSNDFSEIEEILKI